MMIQKKSIVTMFIFPAIVVFVVIILLINNQNKLPGELVLEQEKINFGEIPEWEGSVTRSLSAQNRGRSKLVVERIETGCSYVNIEGPKELQHGEKAAFQVVFNPKFVPSEILPTTAIIFTNTSKTPQVYLTIDVTVKRFAELSAKVCDFGEIAPNSIHERNLRLCVNAPMNMGKIRLMQPSTPALKWEAESEPSSKCLLIKVKIGPVKVKGQFSSVLTIALPNERILALPVEARVVSPIKVRPDYLFYNIVTQGEEPITEFVLESESPFKILQIHTPKALMIENSPDKEMRRSFTIKVRWHSTHNPQILREEIRVMNNVDPEPIRIPVYGVIHKKK